jgi:transposase-like protein
VELRISLANLDQRLKSLLTDAPGESTPGVAARKRAERQIQRRLTKPEVERLVAAYKTGAGVKELAKRFGVCRDTALNHLKRNGFTPSLRALDDEAVERAKVLYERDGRSLANIGEGNGVDAATVHRALRRVGVVFRDSHGRPQ